MRLACCACTRARRRRPLVWFERARIAARRDGDRASEFLALEHRVGLELRRGRFGDAEVLCTALAELAGRLRQDGSEAPCARALVALCRLAALCSDAEAETELENALTALTAADAKHRLAFALVTAAELDLRARRFASARVRAEEGLRLLSLLDLPSEVAAARATLVRVAAASEDGAECRLQVKALRSTRGRDLSRHARDLTEALCTKKASKKRRRAASRTRCQDQLVLRSAPGLADGSLRFRRR
jgi:hypothetical protein